jgi:type I restriction-modification system DNA methylase subunit/restriction endonuclease S subunit
MSEKKESGSGKMYTCKLCKKTFKQKCDYDKHANKKAPCISLSACEAMIVKKDEKVDVKKNLTTFFKNCLDILRDNEGLTGEKALRNLSYLLILKLLEPHFGGIIDIDNCEKYKYDFKSFFEDDVIDHNKVRLLSCVRFSNLSMEKEANIPIMMKLMWDIILSVHPSTKNIFLPEKRFDIQIQKTYKKIIDKLNEINFSNMENDILGDSYEEVIQDIMTGKVLGQFFTPPSIKKFMINLINPKINDDGTIESCCDPTMGTGGFLIEYIRVILEKARLNGITLNWDFIKNYGLYGKELEPDTYQLAVSNMLISTGHMFEKLDRGDSIREPIEKKFDNILANPPFGIKGLKYDDFQSSLKLQYVPIKSDNAVSLFIQAIIYMLNIGGKCAVVLPDGQDLFSKTNTTLVAVREYLMKTCDLKEIYYLPSGIFEYTTIKTCVLYFVKKREGTDVLEVKINVSKTQKETSRDYKFSKTHQTASIKFYDYNPYEGEGLKNLLVEVPIDKIMSNLYSLNYAEYIKDDAEEEEYEDGIVVKTLGEVCKDISTSKNIPSSDRIDGIFRFFTCSREETTHNEHHYDGTFIIHGSRGSTIKESIFITNNEKFAIGTSMFISEVKNKNECDSKYIYYYLRLNKSMFNKYINGTAIPMISKSNYYDIKIPIPSFERQQEIVKYLDLIYEKSMKTSNEKIAELKQLNEFCLNNQKRFCENVVKTLGEVCEKLNKRGKHSTKDHIDNGNFNLFSSSINEVYKLNTFDYSELCCIINSTNASGNAIVNLGINFSVTSDTFVFKSTNDITTKYIQLFLTNNIQLVKEQFHGANHKHPTWNGLSTIKIPIPSLERQKEIIAYCEFNDMLIQQLEKEIENNKKQAQQFIDCILKSQFQIEED